MTTRRLILLLLMAMIQTVYSSPHSVLERYEERLNSALSKRTGVPRTVKRYKCVEEYVTYDQHGRAVTSYQGSRFTTTMEPPVGPKKTYRTSGEKEIRRKPSKKVTIAINRDSEQHSLTTTPMTVTSSTREPSTTSSLKPFDEMNDEEADRIIEEMYLKKKESHTTESPEDLPEVTRTESSPLPPLPSPPRQYSTSSSSSSSNAGPPARYHPVKQNRINHQDSDEDYPSVYHRGGSRKRPYDMSTYDDYDDIPLYRPMRREYRMRRRRPILFSDDFSDDTEFDQRIDNNPRRQTTRDLSPLRSINSLRHPQYRSPGGPPPPPMSLPVSSSTNMIHRPMPLPMAPQPPPHMRPPPHQMMPMTPGLGGPMPRAPPPPPQPLQPIQQQQSMMNHPGAEDVLKMKPILQANPQEMQVATEESCAKITTLAKYFNIKDVSKWARSNCGILQMYAPTASCELIFHFIDSCRSKKFF